MKISDLIIPVFLLTVIGYGLWKKVDIFAAFVEGAEENLKAAVEILPVLIGLMVGIGMLTASGVLEFFCKIISPTAEFLGFPSECVPLALLKPISGSGSVAMLDGILSENPPDEFIGRVASVVCSAVETTFYTIAIYFSAVKVSGGKRIIFCALLSNLAGFIFSAASVRLFLGG